MSAPDPHPSTYVLGGFGQTVRELLVPGSQTAGKPSTEVVDRRGHRCVVGSGGVTIEHPTGAPYVLNPCKGLPDDRVQSIHRPTKPGIACV